MARIKKNDQVVIIAGKDKGKTGKVLQVMPKQQRAVVEHINMFRKAQRRSQKNPQGGFVDVERSVHISNLMLIDKKTNKPTRLGALIQKDGSKARISRKTQEVV